MKTKLYGRWPHANMNAMGRPGRSTFGKMGIWLIKFEARPTVLTFLFFFLPFLVAHCSESIFNKNLQHKGWPMRWGVSAVFWRGQAYGMPSFLRLTQSHVALYLALSGPDSTIVALQSSVSHSKPARGWNIWALTQTNKQTTEAVQ